MRIACVNGIRSKGEQTTDLLAERLRADYGHDAFDIDLPVRHTWDLRSWKNLQRDAMAMVDQTQDGDGVVAHSAGCLQTAYAMGLCRRFSRVVFFGAALNQDWAFPPEPCGFDGLTNIHNPHDRALLYGSLLLQHPFGPMGRQGYRGPDRRVVNLPRRRKKLFSKNHSHYFRPEEIGDWAEWVHNFITGGKT